MSFAKDKVTDLQWEVGRLTEIKDKFKKRARELKSNGARDKQIVDILFNDYPKIFNEILDYIEPREE
jgi:uncharacterized membrane-anchored protein YhcB (DUF1043 family)|tara:strand:+ start:1031 stop:1231 length:201 start_codon:yes stop_codon:yes gene_type:complete